MGRKAIQRNDARNDDGRVADAVARAGHELNEILDKSRWRAKGRCIVDAECDDEKVGGLGLDAMQDLLPGIADGCAGKTLGAPGDGTPGELCQCPRRRCGNRLVATREPDAAYGGFADGKQPDGFYNAGYRAVMRRRTGGRRGTRRRVAAP